MGKVLTVELLDLEKTFQESIGEKNDGFILDDSIDYGEDYFKKLDFDKIKELYRLNSIYSYKFGLTLQEDDDIIAHLYSCRCGHTIGLDHLDETCPHCGTLVERTKFKDVGWFYIKPRKHLGYENDIKVIHPYICHLLCSMNGGNLVKRLDMANMRTKSFRANAKSLKPITDFTWKDLFFNKEKLKAFISKYMSAHEEMLSMYEDRWYTNVIQVNSKDFRPLKVKNRIGVPTIATKDLNAEYQVLSECVGAINSNPGMIEEQLVNKLKSIVLTLGNICDIINTEIGSGKKSTWRGEVVAPRIDNSGRLIIEPIIDRSIHEIDVIQLPLDFFRVVYSGDVEMICKKLRVEPNKIRELVDPNYELTQIERDFIRNNVFPLVEDPYAYISREPCIYITSVLGMRIHSLIDEMVMRIPFFANPGLVSDYDGDALFVINYGTPKKRRRIYESLGPKRSVIDTLNIKFNDGAFAPNNNAGIVMWKGFKKDATLEEVI